MNRDAAMLLAPHAARMQALLALRLPVHAVLLVAVLIALSIAVAAVVRLEGSR